jgi:DNA-3-methyladenine glycosylase
MRLPRAFFERPSAEVARDLLGKVLFRRAGDGLMAGRIVETEAYGGEDDPGSHAFRGPTQRNAVMFGAAGRIYLYRSYGIHACMNVVCEGEEQASAVLIRALEPLIGIAVMERHRAGRSTRELCNGPGKLCEALEIALADNGVDLEGDEIWIEDDGAHPPKIASSARVGLSRGKEMQLRFFVAGNEYVSRGRPSASAGLESP